MQPKLPFFAFFVFVVLPTGQFEAAELASSRTDRLQQSDVLDYVQQLDSNLRWWQFGYIQRDDLWMTYDQAIDEATGDDEKYFKERDRLRGQKRFHQRMAVWCRHNRLADRARAHLATFARNGGEMKAADLHQLGFRRAGNRWSSPEDLAKSGYYESAVERSRKKFGSAMKDIRIGLRGTPADRTTALVRLRAIRDPDAVAELDKLSRASVDACRQVVRVLRDIECWESSLVLARTAVYHDERSIRSDAIESLRHRPLEQFVPPAIGLISILREPESEFHRPRTARFGHAGLTVQREVETLDSIRRVTSHYLMPTVPIRRRGPSGTDPAAAEAKLKMFIDSKTRQNLDKLEDIEQTNTRVVAMLNGVTGQSEEASPQIWWDWWAQYNDTEPTAKSVIQSRTVEETDVRVPVPAGECFAGDTPVWTETGRRHISTIEVGDRVLACDVETGELAFKAVSHVSVRQPPALTRVNIGDEVITSTGGHRYWETGFGWKRARDLGNGTRIHTINGTAAVSSSESAPSERTWNLVVDDFHSYLVGEGGYLVQDLVYPAPTNAVIPGLSRFEVARIRNASTAD